METKKARVKATTMKREGIGQYGPYFVHTIIFDNGDNGDYMAKTNPQTYFKEGEEAEYTKEVKQNGNYTNTVIKPIQQPKAGFNGGNPTLQNRRVALQCAVELMAPKYAGDFKQLLTTAEEFEKWINGAADKPAAQPQQQSTGANDDLPF